MIRSFIFTRFPVCCAWPLWVLYQMEDIMSTMDVTALLASAKHVALFYAAGLLVYLAVTYWIYSRRYERASKGMKIHATSCAVWRKKNMKLPSVQGEK